ncbi:hypothetical protein ACRBEV_27005 [Methylobacterium phyllosphaerae]
MSGPKVVRIVTREEIEATCRQHIARLDEAIDALRAVAKRLNRLNAALEAELARQRQVLTRQFEAEQWMQLQKQAPELTASVRAQIDRLRTEAVAEAAAARTRHRRLAEGARSLINALEAQRLPVDPALRNAVTQALTADDNQVAAIQATMNAALRQLSQQPGHSANNDAQKAFVQRLAAGTEGQSLTGWLASLPQPVSRDTRLDRLLAEIATRGEAAALQAFTERAVAIMDQPDDHRRALLTDSLTLDVGRWVSERQQIERAIGRLQEARAELAPFTDPEATTVSQQITRALETNNHADADRLLAAAHDVAEHAAKRAAAEARRQAVLSGLAALGYEVRAGMTTAWAQDGRLVLRKPASDDYGVELGATPDLARLQVRLVGADQPQQPRNQERDRDQETIWCSEFRQLQEDLAKHGDNMVIERALEPGAQPVKSISMPFSSGNTHEIEQETPRNNYRTLR